MRYITLALVLLLSLPAGATELKGQVDKNQVDWAGWHKRFQEEVRRRLIYKSQFLNMPVDGRLELKVTVTNHGDIGVEVLEDACTNMSLLAPNIIEGLGPTSFSTFPKNSRRSQITFDMILEKGENSSIIGCQDLEEINGKSSEITDR